MQDNFKTKLLPLYMFIYYCCISYTFEPAAIGHHAPENFIVFAMCVYACAHLSASKIRTVKFGCVLSFIQNFNSQMDMHSWAGYKNKACISYCIMYSLNNINCIPYLS